MKTLIILVANYEKEHDIEPLIEFIIMYVGARMLETLDLEKGAPVISLNDTLSERDKTVISSSCGSYICPIFLEYSENEHPVIEEHTYITAKIKK